MIFPIVLSIQIAILATIINLPIALLISWLIVKKQIRGSAALELLMTIPLAIPPTIIGFFVLVIFGINGPIGKITNDIFGFNIIFTWIAATLVTAIISFPLMARAIIVSMSEVNPNLEKTARGLGAGPIKVFFSITVPLSYRGILAGSLICFVRALSEFGATIIVAGNMPKKTQTISLAIYSAIQSGDESTAFSLSAVALGIAIVSLVVYNILLKKDKRNLSNNE
ncbi:MAG: molybdate ABC transporter permease subunit [SAR202 cluster bacterium]|nr:molybdate ABC transporter permease subunit [Chloroflexota bacterium]MQG39221.1 molybdate ABC transporter permease subunit [SAR202 cluster bacterium]|tara:strand:- start:478 stop:1152 length:675 start_codon:yes stop_codon:yes gene_type:complete